jgi:hypothetical protein
MKLLSLSPSSEEKFRKEYLNDHSKFIHTSWLLKEDLGKTSVINGVNWTIVGLWDIEGIRRQILLRSENGTYAFEDSKIVCQGMGIYNMRNLVTGQEHKDWVFTSKNLTPMDISSDENESEEIEESGVWTRIDDETSNEDEDEIVDPLVKALQEDITDEYDY